MSRLRAALRREIVEATLALPAEERVTLALRLGDADVELAARPGEPAGETRARLARQRRSGRRPSRCASEA